jgi:hypothetical protein
MGEKGRKALNGRDWYEEGDLCPECLGVMVIQQAPCYCSATNNPPCANCEHSWLGCAECGWIEEYEEDNLQENGMKTIVGVKFVNTNRELSEKTYSYKTYSYLTDIEGVEVNDWAVVIVEDKPVCVRVVEVVLSESQRSKANKWLAFKVDLTDYYKKVAKQKLITEIEQELDDQVKKVQRYEVFKACAKTSPKMQELLARLGELDPSVNLIEGEEGDNV